MTDSGTNGHKTVGARAPCCPWLLLPSLGLALALLTVGGCADTDRSICRNVILPEQRTIERHDPTDLPPARIPDTVPPRTVTDPKPDETEWPLSLDDAIRITLENGKVVRVLTGTGAVASGQTIYDAAITNTTIDQAQARFDPTLQQNNTWSRTDTPQGTVNPLDPVRSLLLGEPIDSYQSVLGVTKTNVLGGQLAANYTETPVIFTNVPNFFGGSNTLSNNGAFANTFSGLALNPEQTHTLQLSYTQPLLQGAGFQVNMAPIVIARLNTEQSYFQYKDGVQNMVLGVVTAYWNLVQARTDLWARKIQLELSEETFKREQARLETGLGNRGNEAQARVTYNQFRASLIAAEAAVLTQEGTLRNIMGIAPDDNRKIVPTSQPAERRLKPDWDALVKLAEQRRPDIVELKIITEADRERLVQADNQMLPQLNAVASYQFNGLSGTMPNGDRVSTAPGQFDTWSVGINFSVPLGLRQGRAAVRQQKLLVIRDQANVEQGIHAAVHELAGTVRDLESDFEQYQAFKETRAAAFTNVEVQIGNQRVGLVNYLNVLQAINDWGSAVSSEAQQLLSYNVALATLERETGTILETHGLVFNEERFRAAGPIPCRERLYPEATVAGGVPQFTPGSDQPSEEVFDLKKPDWRNARPVEALPEPKPGPPNPVPPPDRPPPPVPLPDKPAPPATGRLTPTAHFPDLLEWPLPAHPTTQTASKP